MAAPSPPPPRDARARGFAAALSAYLAWGFFPVYFKALKGVPAPEILCHRIVWSAAFLAVLVTAQRRWGEFGAAFRGGRLTVFVATTLLISLNWLLYIWAVNAGRILEASLGYFVNPLVNVLLGVLFLRERLTRRQQAAVALALGGVLVLVVRAGTFPWVSLTLALSFGLYGLVRKKARIDAVVGLLVETSLLAPLALGWLVLVGLRGDGAFGSSPGPTALLALAGLVTALPLIGFAVGMRSLRLSTMGLIQYITPTLQFLLAVLLYREPFTRAHAAAFGLIWASLGLYSFEALRGQRAGARASAEAPGASPVPLD